MNAPRPARAGQFLRAHVAPPPADHAARRANLVAACVASRTSRSPTAWILVLSPAIAVIAVLVGVMLRRRAQATVLQFTVGPENQLGTVGAFVAPIGHDETTLHFSDGSSVVLEPSSRARVATTSAHGARLLVEQGRARVNVVPRAQSDWAVAAGPYTVSVVGTSFDVRWDGSNATLDLNMHHGIVVVHGPGFETGTTVRAPDHFTTRVIASLEAGVGPSQGGAQRAFTPPRGELPSSASEPPLSPSEPLPSPTKRQQPAVSKTSIGTLERAPAIGATASSSAVVAPVDRERPYGTNASSASWSRLAAEGGYAAIVADAERHGVESSLSMASDEDLIALANAARYTGHPDLARRALLAVRSRFAQSIRAASAAFLLGRTAEDAGRTSEAIGWYDRYLEEAPKGSLAAEALGRSMVARRDLGDGVGAGRAAGMYLERYPNGSYASMARDMVRPR